MPESISVSDLDFKMLKKVLSIEEEFFDNLKISELTDEVWEKMIVLNPTILVTDLVGNYNVCKINYGKKEQDFVRVKKSTINYILKK